METNCKYFIENKFGQWMVGGMKDGWTNDPLKAKSFKEVAEARGWEEFIRTSIISTNGSTITSELLGESKITEHCF